MARLGVVRLFSKKGEEGRKCCTYNLVPPPLLFGRDVCAFEYTIQERDLPVV